MQTTAEPRIMTYSLQTIAGDTELTFTKNHIRVKWRGAGLRERGMLRTLFGAARQFGFTAYTVDEDGKKKQEAKRLPGLFRGKEGELLLSGEQDRISEMAKLLVEDDVKSKSIVLEAQSDNTWKRLKAGEFEAPKPDEKEKKVTSSRPVGGG